jgi:hypothetical protein
MSRLSSSSSISTSNRCCAATANQGVPARARRPGRPAPMTDPDLLAKKLAFAEIVRGQL